MQMPINTNVSSVFDAAGIARRHLVGTFTVNEE
jgi:hypothetical protein